MGTLTVPKTQRPLPRQIKIERPTLPPRCDPVHKRVLLSQIRMGVELKKVAAPICTHEPVVIAGDGCEPSPQVEPSTEDGQWVDVEDTNSAELQELEEWGFTDKALNAEMLAKHGSVKAAVKQLVQLNIAA